MLKYSGYLKELGVKKSDFKPKRWLDSRYFNDKHSNIAEVETWNLDYTLIMVLYSYLRRFKECSKAIPARFTDEEWNKILDDMIKGFEDYIRWSYSEETKRDTCDEYFTEREQMMKGVEYSMWLLSKYLFDLSW